MRVLFGDFSFDPTAMTLLRRGRPIHLTPKAFGLLRILLAHSPNPVRRSELVRRLWSGTFVGEGNLPNLILELRRILDDAQRHGLVRTVHGVGYAFVGMTQEVIDKPPGLGMFRVWVGGREIGLVDGENRIGRALECRVHVGCSSASRRHALIRIAGRRATIEDTGSRHGTFLNGERVSGVVPLSNGDEIKVGSVTIYFRIVRPEAPTDGRPPRTGSG